MTRDKRWRLLGHEDIAFLKSKLKKKAKVNLETGCILFTGNKDILGYGFIFYYTKGLLAHRVVALIHKRLSSIIDPMMVCHKCDNPSCINPKHLFIGTQSDNQKDAVRKKRHACSAQTHCINGHELKGKNLYTYTFRGSVKRACKTCKAQNKVKYRIKKLLSKKVTEKSVLVT